MAAQDAVSEAVVAKVRLLDGRVYLAEAVEIKDGFVHAVARRRGVPDAPLRRYAWNPATVDWVRWEPSTERVA